MHMKSAPTEDEINNALTILAEDQSRKMAACMDEIQEILDKYEFDIAVSNPTISLVAKPSKKQRPESAINSNTTSSAS